MPKSWLRARLYRLIRHPAFDSVVMLFIILNVVALASEADDISPGT